MNFHEQAREIITREDGPRPHETFTEEWRRIFGEEHPNYNLMIYAGDDMRATGWDKKADLLTAKLIRLAEMAKPWWRRKRENLRPLVARTWDGEIFRMDDLEYRFFVRAELEILGAQGMRRQIRYKMRKYDTN